MIKRSPPAVLKETAEAVFVSILSLTRVPSSTDQTAASPLRIRTKIRDAS
jgi:hypothetical protein